MLLPADGWGNREEGRDELGSRELSEPSGVSRPLPSPGVGPGQITLPNRGAYK